LDFFFYVLRLHADAHHREVIVGLGTVASSVRFIILIICFYRHNTNLRPAPLFQYHLHRRLLHLHPHVAIEVQCRFVTLPHIQRDVVAPNRFRIVAHVFV